MNIDYGAFFRVCFQTPLIHFFLLSPIPRHQFATNLCAQKQKFCFSTKICVRQLIMCDLRTLYLHCVFLTLHRHKVGFIDYVNRLYASKMWLFTFRSLILLIK